MEVIENPWLCETSGGQCVLQLLQLLTVLQVTRQPQISGESLPSLEGRPVCGTKWLVYGYKMLQRRHPTNIKHPDIKR